MSVMAVHGLHSTGNNDAVLQARPSPSSIHVDHVYRIGIRFHSFHDQVVDTAVFSSMRSYCYRTTVAAVQKLRVARRARAEAVSSGPRPWSPSSHLCCEVPIMERLLRIAR